MHTSRAFCIAISNPESDLALDGTVWVTDFGLARMHDSDDLTNTGEILGTLRYLAPERLHGTHTVQGDIYGLGMTLYELLTLQPAFAATDRPELLRQVMEQTPVSPRRLTPRSRVTSQRLLREP